MQRRSHVETEAETGRRRPPSQGRTPGAPRSWKRREGPSPGASAGGPAQGHPDLRRWSPGRDRMPSCDFKCFAPARGLRGGGSGGGDPTGPGLTETAESPGSQLLQPGEEWGAPGRGRGGPLKEGTLASGTTAGLWNGALPSYTGNAIHSHRPFLLPGWCDANHDEGSLLSG